jgi:hypothetical protein
VEDQFNNNQGEPESEVLKNMNRSNVFHTPEHYFEKLPVFVSDQIHKKTKTDQVHNWMPARIAAFSGLVLVAIVAGWIYFSGVETEKSSNPVLSYDDLVGSGMVSEMDESMLMEEYAAQTNNASGMNQTEVVSNQELIKEYLIENNTDITLIINEL